MDKIKNNDRKVDFILDTIYFLKEQALEARRDSLANPEDDFKMGIMFGYYEVLRLLQQQSQSFEIPLKELNLDDLDAEEDILGMKHA